MSITTKLPLVSIVTPSLNQGEYLESTILSVQNQAYKNIEHIIRDAVSSDNTADVIRKYYSILSNVKSERDGGQADAIHNGFIASSGEILGWLNADDILCPDAISKIVEFFIANPKVDIIYGNRITINSEGRVIGQWKLPHQHSRYCHRRWAMIPQETCFWRRECYFKVGGLDRSLHFAMDYDLFTKFDLYDFRFQPIDLHIGCFRIHEKSKTSNLLQSTGRKECELIRSMNNIHNYPWDRFIGKFFYHRITGGNPAGMVNDRHKLPYGLRIGDKFHWWSES